MASHYPHLRQKVKRFFFAQITESSELPHSYNSLVMYFDGHDVLCQLLRLADPWGQVVPLRKKIIRGNVLLISHGHHCFGVSLGPADFRHYNRNS